MVCLGKLGRDMITALRPYSAFMGKWQKCEQLDDTHTQDTFFFHHKKVEILLFSQEKCRSLAGHQTEKNFSLVKWRILSQPTKIGSGKNRKSLFFLLGLKITLRTCFESNNFLSNSCPELSNQVLSFSEGQIY